jgi:DegV family protein with EDD domain
MNKNDSSFHIVMDSAGDIPSSWLEEYRVNIIPINIHFGEKTYLQGVTLSNEEFYKKASESAEFPKTSQPTPQQFIDYYRKIAKAGDSILSLHVTGKLSGTLASAQMAARELRDEFNIYPFDSRSGSAAMGFFAREARLLEMRNMSIQEILKHLDNLAEKVQIVLTLKSMEFARRSGRVKALQAALASLLNVKPVIYLKNGELILGDRVRTWNRALEFVVDEVKKRISNRPVNAAVVHAEDPESAQAIFHLVKKKLNVRDLIITSLSIGVAANLGPGTTGLIVYPVEEMNE